MYYYTEDDIRYMQAQYAANEATREKDKVICELQDKLKSANAEIERLKKPISASAMFQIAEASVEKAEKFIAGIKSEAYKEFAERLKERADELKLVHLDGKWAISQYDVDKLLKELEGDNGQSRPPVHTSEMEAGEDG